MSAHLTGNTTMPDLMNGRLILFGRMAAFSVDGGPPVRLPPAQYVALHALMKNKGRVVASSSLLDSIYFERGEPERARECLKVVISLLRRALKRAGLPGIIGASYGWGYMLANLSTTHGLVLTAEQNQRLNDLLGEVAVADPDRAARARAALLA